MEVSPLGVARLYRDIVGLFVLDNADRRYCRTDRALWACARSPPTPSWPLPSAPPRWPKWFCERLRCSTVVAAMRTISLTAIEGIPMVKAGDNLAALIAKGLADTGFKLEAGDILVVCQKVVSKAEGRVVNFNDYRALRVRQGVRRAMGEGSARGRTRAATDQPNRAQRSRRADRRDRTRMGLRQRRASTSPTASRTSARSCCPKMPTRSARRLRDEIRQLTGVESPCWSPTRSGVRGATA